MAPGPHPDLVPLFFLAGTWEGGGDGEYPTVRPFRYRERISFEHVGDPFLLYAMQSWDAEDDAPVHFERGFLRAGSGPGDIELTLAHPLGLTEVSQGRLKGTTLELSSRSIGRTDTGSLVEGVVRRYRVSGQVMRYEIDMAMRETPMTRHLTGELRRIGP
jgi:hypothetical protein